MQAPEEKARGITIATAHGMYRLSRDLHTFARIQLTGNQRQGTALPVTVVACS